tara:strand:+ start:922 stop:1062 length:141 start_codon:yes stop_codon:yes gene_type:complete
MKPMITDWCTLLVAAKAREKTNRNDNNLLARILFFIFSLALGANQG